MIVRLKKRACKPFNLHRNSNCKPITLKVLEVEGGFMSLLSVCIRHIINGVLCLVVTIKEV